MGEEERRARHGVIPVTLVALHERHPSGFDDVEDSRLEFRRSLGERFVHALCRFEGGLLLEPLGTVILKLVAQSGSAHGEHSGHDDTHHTQENRERCEPDIAGHAHMLLVVRSPVA